MKSLLFQIARIHNWFADRDFLWWPFAWMRPEKNEIMTLRQSTLISLAFSTLLTLLLAGFSLMQGTLSIEGIFYYFALFFTSFWPWFAGITRPLWNIRARSILKNSSKV